MIIEQNIQIGNKYRFVCSDINTVVKITQSPIKNSCGFLEYGAIDENGVYRICFNDELYSLDDESLNKNYNQ